MKAIWDVLFPRFCVCCGCPDCDVCARCWDVLRPSGELIWSVMALPDDVPVWSVGEYSGDLRRFVLAVKHRDSFRGQSYVFKLGFALGVGASKSSLWAGLADEVECVWVIPSPSSVRRRFSGREVVLPLACGVACGLAAGLGVRCEVVEACRLRWRSRSQSGRSGQERRLGRVGQMRGVIEVPARVGVVCVDDVVTTGATIREMVRAVGKVPLGVFALAAVS